jgi:hypothetical protein
MRQNRLKTLEISVNESNTFGDLLNKLGEQNPLISAGSSFVNINGQIYYNPFDGPRRSQK